MTLAHITADSTDAQIFHALSPAVPPAQQSGCAPMYGGTAGR